MKLRSKLIALLMATVLCTGLVACGSGSGGGTDSSVTNSDNESDTSVRNGNMSDYAGDIEE